MEGLDNRQIILLTLLVSFVTSIATGIVTVTLMEEAPVGFTSSVNKIVQTTVEKVVPKETVVEVVREVRGENPATLISAVVEERAPALVLIQIGIPITGSAEVFRGETKTQVGFFVTPNGLIATAKENMEEGHRYNITYGDKKESMAEVYFTEGGVALLGLVQRDVESGNEDLSSETGKIVSGNAKVSYIPMSKSLPPLGSHVVSLGKSLTKGTTVLDGIISSYSKDENDLVTSIRTTISRTQGGNGGPLMTLTGELIGITNYTSNEEIYYPMSDIANLIKLYIGENEVAGDTSSLGVSGQANSLESL